MSDNYMASFFDKLEAERREMSGVKRWRHDVTWAGLQICATTMAMRNDGEYVLASDYDALAQRCRELETERGDAKADCCHGSQLRGGVPAANR